jgi:hypothetical protein
MTVDITVAAPHSKSVSPKARKQQAKRALEQQQAQSASQAEHVEQKTSVSSSRAGLKRSKARDELLLPWNSELIDHEAARAAAAAAAAAAESDDEEPVGDRIRATLRRIDGLTVGLEGGPSTTSKGLRSDGVRETEAELETLQERSRRPDLNDSQYLQELMKRSTELATEEEQHARESCAALGDMAAWVSYHMCKQQKAQA